MKRLPILVLAALISTGSGGCQGVPVPETRIGINVPPPGTYRVFRWDAVPGASAYQVVVTIDRNGTQPVGVTGFTADTQVTSQAVAWREGHPVVGRPYFWVVRAYDRPDPQGALLTVRGPHDVAFEQADMPQSGPSNFPALQPSAIPASTAPATTSPSPSVSPAAPAQ